MSELDPFEKNLTQMFDRHTEFLRERSLEIKELKTLYVGGGTPSLWSERGADFLNEQFNKRGITQSKESEFTLEVNPGTWSEETIKAWLGFGINRFSLGVQSLRSDFLKILDRVHNVEDVHETLSFFKELGLEFSVDFMLGLPFSKKYNRDIEAELDEILKYEPGHISLYILTVKNGYTHFEKLPSDEFTADEYLLVAKKLANHGYSHYEVSNFAKSGRESIHNLQYWKCENVAALGPSGVGFLRDTHERYRWKVTSAELTLEKLTGDEFFTEDLYMNMRTNRGFNPLKYFPEKESELKSILTGWEKEGLGHGAIDSFTLSSRGFLGLDGLFHVLINNLSV